MSKDEGMNQFNLSTYKNPGNQDMRRSYFFLALYEVAWFKL